MNMFLLDGGVPIPESKNSNINKSNGNDCNDSDEKKIKNTTTTTSSSSRSNSDDSSVNGPNFVVTYHHSTSNSNSTSSNNISQNNINNSNNINHNNNDSTSNLISSSLISFPSGLTMTSSTSGSVNIHSGSNCSLFGSSNSNSNINSNSKTNLQQQQSQQQPIQLQHGLHSTPTALDFLFLHQQHEDEKNNVGEQNNCIQQHKQNQDGQIDSSNQGVSVSVNDSQQQQQQQQKSVLSSAATLLTSSESAVSSVSHYNNVSVSMPNRSALVTGGISPTRRSSSNQLPTRKSVDFAILPPSPKRMRQTLHINGQSSSSSSSSLLLSTSDLLQIGPSSSPCYYRINPYTNNNNNNNTLTTASTSTSTSSSTSSSSSTTTKTLSPNTSTSTNGSILISPPVPTNDCCWNARQVVDAISTCICPSERIEAITNAIESLDHNNQELHNEEMSTGIDSAMTKHLTFLVYQYKLLLDDVEKKKYSSINDNTTTITTDSSSIGKKIALRNEIALTVTAMESLYRASSQVVGVSFERMGNELLQLLVIIINAEINSRQTLFHEQGKLHENDFSLISSADVLGATAITPSSTVTVSTTAATINQTLENKSNIDIEPGDVPVATATTAAAGSTVVAADVNDAVTTTQNILDKNNNTSAAIADIHGDELLKRGTKILAHLARVANATKIIAHHPGVLETLLKLLGTTMTMTTLQVQSIPWEARLSALWTIANLACNPENMSMMVNCTNLIPSLVQVANRDFALSSRISSSMATTTTKTATTAPTQSLITTNNITSLEATMEVLRSRSTASRAILNLSWSTDNKVSLAEYPDLIHLLCTLCITRTPGVMSTNDEELCPATYLPHRMYHKSKTIQEIMLTTRRYAAGALRNIAAAPKRVKIMLCNYHHGRILQVLADAASNDTDPTVQERIFGTIHNLANHSTADTIINHTKLVDVFKNVLLSATTTTTLAENDNDSTNSKLRKNSIHMDNSVEERNAVDLSQFRGNSSNSTSINTPRRHVYAIITVLERSITEEMIESYEKLRNLLQTIRPTTTTKNSTNTNKDSCDSLSDGSTSSDSSRSSGEGRNTINLITSKNKNEKN